MIEQYENVLLDISPQGVAEVKLNNAGQTQCV